MTVQVAPEHVWIESDLHSQSVSLDLLIENHAAEPVDLDEIRISVFDRSGKLALRKFIDGNGTRPSIRTADVSAIEPGGRALVFNPFHDFSPELELAKLTFDLKLSSKDGSRIYTASVDVRPEPYRSGTHLILPIAARAIVYDGHDFYGHHRRWDYTIPMLRQLGFHTNFMRYSYDFVPVDADGNMASGPEEKNESWVGFGLPVRAAAAGVVVSVLDTEPDDRTFDPATIETAGPMKIWGNYLVIDHGHGEYSLYGHIRQGSSRVKVGQGVKSGDVIAAIGASGSSKFPHLHYELQTGPDTNAEGLPSRFERYDRIAGSRRIRVTSGHINSGDIVQSR